MSTAPVSEKIKQPAAEKNTIRVAVIRDASRLELTGYNAVIEGNGKRFQLQPHSIISVKKGSIIVNGITLTQPISIRSPGSIAVNGKKYFGHLVIKDGYLINLVPLDQYLIGVIHSEVPDDWPMEALKAQAIVSRTYAYKRIIENRNKLFDVGSTQLYQKYDFVESNSRIKRAVRDTKDKIILYKNEPIEAFFHSCSGGRTENSGDIFQKDLPYLRSIPDPYCARDERSEWEYTVSVKDIEGAVKKLINPVPETNAVKDIRIYRRTGSGRVKEFLIRFTDNKTVTLDGNSFRLAMDPQYFKSLLIGSIRRDRKDGEVYFTFQGRGYGHGVGLSQWGAKKMAEQGFTHKHIIAHYYRGTRIGTIQSWDIR